MLMNSNDNVNVRISLFTISIWIRDPLNENFHHLNLQTSSYSSFPFYISQFPRTKKNILLTFIFYIHISILYNIEMFNWSERKGGKKVCKRMPFLNNNDIVAWNWEAPLSKEDGIDGEERRKLYRVPFFGSTEDGKAKKYCLLFLEITLHYISFPAYFFGSLMDDFLYFLNVHTYDYINSFHARQFNFDCGVNFYK